MRSAVVGDSSENPARLRELASLFLRLGFTAFGGSAAHIALMEDEIVRRRQWVTHEQDRERTWLSHRAR